MKRLLFIEDDGFAYQSIALLLKNIGYSGNRIVRCSHLQDLAEINTEDIEIVLTGFHLPDPCNQATFKKIKKIFPYTPIIALGNTADIDVAINIIRQGAQDYLVKKECNEEMLRKTLLYAIERNRIFDNTFIEKQNLRAIVNNTEDIIWSVDKKYNIISANNAFWGRIKKISGKGENEASISDFDKDLVKTWTGFYEQAFNGELSKMIWSEKTDNGNKTYEEVRFNLIYDKDKNTIGVSCFSRDITKQLKYQKMIRKQNDQLKQIAWIHSHDVRGPVASILGIAHLFNTDDPGNPENIEILENLKIAANKLDDIIKKINSYTITIEESS